MYVHTIPNRTSPPAILLREGYREGGKAKSRTIANISGWAPERIEALARALKGEFDGIGGADPVADRVFGVLFVLKELADRIGLTRVLGRTKMGKLVLFLILARIADQGSRLSAARWARDHCVSEILGLEEFNEDDLYQALDWLTDRQDELERKLYLHYRRKDANNILVLYDVTSSYLEGQFNEYGEYGYNRDKKKGKKQIVIGLLTGPDGEPLSVKVFKGNTSDPCTVSSQIDTLKERFGIKEVVFVGDRGMVKSKGKHALFENGFKYITALTNPQIRKLLQQDVIQLNLFDATVCEVNHGNVRLVLRKNTAVSRKHARRRDDKLLRLRELIVKRNEFVLNSPRADPEAGLRTLSTWADRHKLSSFVQLSLDDNRTIELYVDEDARSQAGLLDGCYVMETDVSAEMMDAQTVEKRYRSLQQVERDFRSLKNGFLEVRPVYVRKTARTTAHVFITMLALKIIRKAESLLKEAAGESTEKLRFPDALRTMSRLSFLRYSVKHMEFLRLPQLDTHQIDVCTALGIRPPVNKTPKPVSAGVSSK